MNKCINIKSAIKDIKDPTQKKMVLKFLLKDTCNYVKNLSLVESEISRFGYPSKLAERKIFYITRKILKQGYLVEKKIGSKFIVKKIKKTFRDICSGLFFKGKLFEHGFKKPAGYPGDHKIIELLYDNRPISKGLGYYMDRFALDDEYVVAVRNRMSTMRGILNKFLSRRRQGTVKILNLGCGSCRELTGLSGTNNDVLFTLVDQDNSALSFSKNRLVGRNINSGNIKFKFIQENVILLHRNEEISKELGLQDIVYSIGLADYIPNLYLQNLITFCFNLLKDEGVFVLAHKDLSSFPSLTSDWICDWTFIPRSKKQLVKILEEALKGQRYSIKYKKIKNGQIYFVHIKKLKRLSVADEKI